MPQDKGELSLGQLGSPTRTFPITLGRAAIKEHRSGCTHFPPVCRGTECRGAAHHAVWACFKHPSLKAQNPAQKNRVSALLLKWVGQGKKAIWAQERDQQVNAGHTELAALWARRLVQAWRRRVGVKGPFSSSAPIT